MAAVLSVLVALAIAGAPSQALAGSAGQLYAFGENSVGQLGSEVSLGETVPNPMPALVTFPAVAGAVTEAAAGGRHSLAVTATGQLYAFGSNGYGQLGVATNNGGEANPTPLLVTLPGASGPVTQVAAGLYHSLVVTSTGQLYAFGNNRYGQLGRVSNEQEPDSTPTLVSLPGASGPVTQVAAGRYHSLALTSTGQLYAFGENRYGQLGDATNIGSEEPNPTPTLVTLPGSRWPVTQIAAGGGFSLAVNAIGQLYEFGDDDSAGLGSLSNGEPSPTPTLVKTGLHVTQVAAGLGQILVLTYGGSLYGFGSNYFGELGVAANVGANRTPSIVTLPGASGAVAQIAAGPDDSFAVTSSGQLYAFGGNYYGNLGNPINAGTEAANPTPTLVTLPVGTTIDAVARGPVTSHTLAIVADLAVTGDLLPGGQVGAPYSASTQAAGGTPPYTWSANGLPAGLTINSANGQITGTPTSAGSASVTLLVTDADGIIAASSAIAVTITPAPPVRPSITSAKLSHKRFRVAKQATAIAATKTPLGTTVHFTLSAAAKLQITITRTAPGLRHGHRCMAPTSKLKRAHAKRCTRTLAIGVLTRANEPEGSDTVAFSGRVGHRALQPGAYAAALNATNAGGRSNPVKLSFLITP